MFLWTFRRNENDVVNLYNTLSPVMQLATGGNMLNFGYWEDGDISPTTAQNRLCDITGSMAELDSAKSLLDIGSGLSSPAMKWSLLYPNIEILCVNTNYDQLQEAKNHFSEVVKNALYQGPQTVTRHGVETVIIYIQRGLSKTSNPQR